MFHYSLEHMDKIEAVLAKARELIFEDGTMVIRIPVADCEVFDIYRENWVQLDAPRHQVISSRKGIELLAKKMVLKLFMLTMTRPVFNLLEANYINLAFL